MFWRGTPLARGPEGNHRDIAVTPFFLKWRAMTREELSESRPAGGPTHFPTRRQHAAAMQHARNGVSLRFPYPLDTLDTLDTLRVSVIVSKSRWMIDGFDTV